MLKVVTSFVLLAICMASAVEYIAAPAIIPRYATQYIAPLQASSLSYAAPVGGSIAAPLITPLGFNKLALPLAAAAGYSHYSSVATPNSYSQQYRLEQKPLAYSSIYY